MGPSLLLYPSPLMFFISFLCYVTVELAALQFNSPSVTLLNHYPHLFYVQFLLTTSPAHTIYSFTLQEPPYLVIPFQTPGKPQRLLGKLLFFLFLFLFFCFFTKVGQQSLKSGEVRLGMHKLIEGRLQLTRG